MVCVAASVPDAVAAVGSARRASEQPRSSEPAPSAASVRGRFFLEAFPDPASPGAPKLLLRTAVYDGSLRADGVDLALPTRDGAARAGITFVGATATRGPLGAAPLPGRSHFLLENDPSKWIRDVPQFAEAEQRDVRPGVSVRWHGRDGRLEFDVRVAPGGDAESVAFALDGTSGARVDDAGAIVAAAGDGEIRLSRPVAWQQTELGRRTVAARYDRRSDGSFGFALGEHDPRLPVVVDPVVDYRTRVLPTGQYFPNNITGVSVAADGSCFCSAWTAAATGVSTPGAFQTTYGTGLDTVVEKLDAAGAIAWSTYIGGTASDQSLAVAAGADGTVTVFGATSSSNFPLKDALQAAKAGAAGTTDLFVTRLAADGASLVWSTYFGGSGGDGGSSYSDALALDADGNVCIAGTTSSADFPVAGAVQPALAGTGSDAFVAKIAADGQSVLFSTYLGGTGPDDAQGLALAPGGDVIVSGSTQSQDFPRVGGFAGPSLASTTASSGWVARVAADGSVLRYSTYLGGYVLAPVVVAADGDGAAIVTGTTPSASFPTLNAVQPEYRGGNDAFVMKIRPDGASYEWSTFLGSEPLFLANEGSPHLDQGGLGIAVDPAGSVYVVGLAGDIESFPTVNPLPESAGFGTYAFLAKLPPDGSRLLYSTGLAGPLPSDVAVDATGAAFVGVYTDVVRVSFTIPDAPTDAEAHATPDGSILVTWNEASVDEESFEIQRREGTAAFVTVGTTGPGATSFTDPAVAPGQAFDYRVRAVNGAGPSAFSAVASASVPATLTITARHGTLVNSYVPARDRLTVSGTLRFLAASPDGIVDPSTDAVTLRVGPPDAPLVLSIPAGDPGWKVRRGRNVWKSPGSAEPRWTLTLDQRRGAFHASVSRADFTAAPDGTVRIVLFAGSDAGSGTTQWRRTRPGVFVLP